MKEEFIRTAALIGESAVDKLSECRVAVFGVGGVGGYVCEALARAGVGQIDVFDADTEASILERDSSFMISALSP